MAGLSTACPPNSPKELLHSSAGQRELCMAPTSQSGHKPRSNPAYKEGSTRPCHTTMSKVKLRGLRFFDPHVSMRREQGATLLFPLSTIQEGHRGIEYTPECIGSRFHTAPPRLPKQTRQLPTKPTLSRNSAPNWSQELSWRECLPGLTCS